MSKEYDVAVVGGGLLGSAIAWGLGRLGKKVVVLDEGDIAKRASRANFALVWVQSKGLGMPAYTGWTMRASEAWGKLAAELKDQTGLDVALQQNGGFHLTLGEDEFAQRSQLVTRMHNQVGAADYKMEMLSASEVRKMLPLIGPEVSGGSFCPLDGHVNSLRTFRAFHTGLKLFGVDYFPGRPVSAIAAAHVSSSGPPERCADLGRHPRDAAGWFSDLRSVGGRAGRFRHLLSFRCDARLQPRLRYCPDGRGGRARTGTRRRVLGPPL